MALGRYTAVAIALGCALAPSGAFAESGRLADFTAHLTTASPAAPSGLDVHILLHRAEDRNAKPSPIRSAVIRAPAGIRFDSEAATQCTASDDEIRARGSDACPKESELTVGKFSAITGFGPPVDPLAGDDHVFNGANQLIEVITAPGSFFSPAFDRLTITGSTLTAHPPKAPGGPPDGESAVRSIDFNLPVRRSSAHSLITTPRSCPRSGRWTTTGTFGFADGTSDTVATTTPCRSRTRATMKLALHPRHVRAGRRARFHVHVTSSRPSCARGATVRLAGRAARTGADGRATLLARFALPRVARAVARKAGCGHAVRHLRAVSV